MSYRVDVPVQVTCTMDTDGRIHPQRLRYREQDSSITSGKVIRVAGQRQGEESYALTYVVWACFADSLESQLVELSYCIRTHNWRLRK